MPCVDNDFRLVGGSNTSGRIEVCVDGLWGTICANSLDDETAAEICKQIGLKGKSIVSPALNTRASVCIFSTTYTLIKR